MEKNQTSTMLKLTQALFFTNAAIWFLFGAMNLFRVIEVGSALRWVLTIVMIANAAILLWFGVEIADGRMQLFPLAIVYTALNAVLSLTDQFGWVDFLILLLNLCLLGLLFVTRHRMNQAAEAPSEE
jgi:hypothetical protein